MNSASDGSATGVEVDLALCAIRSPHRPSLGEHRLLDPLVGVILPGSIRSGRLANSDAVDGQEAKVAQDEQPLEAGLGPQTVGLRVEQTELGPGERQPGGGGRPVARGSAGR